MSELQFANNLCDHIFAMIHYNAALAKVEVTRSPLFERLCQKLVLELPKVCHWFR